MIWGSPAEGLVSLLGPSRQETWEPKEEACTSTAWGLEGFHAQVTGMGLLAWVCSLCHPSLSFPICNSIKFF